MTVPTMATQLVAGAPVFKARDYAGAGIILTRIDGGCVRVLCLRGRSSGVWSFSKGHPEAIDEGKPLRTAARETMEETGLVAGIDYTILGDSVRYGKRPYWIGVLAAGVEANRVRVARAEHDMAAWLTVEEVRKMRGNTDVRAWVKKMGGTFVATLNMWNAAATTSSSLSAALSKQPMH